MVISYQQGKVPFEAISGYICLYVYDFPRRTKYWDQDRCSDFFVFVHPRLKKMADSFVFSGTPFEAYLNVTLKHQMNSFLRKMKEKELKESLFCRMCASGSLEDEGSFYKIYDTFNYEVREKDSTYRSRIAHVRMKKRLLFVALSNPYVLDDNLIAQVSDVTGYSADCISRTCKAVKEKIQEKRESLQHMRENRNGYYFQILVIQSRIMDETDSDKRIWLEEEIQRLRLRIERISKKITAKASCLVSHQDLAQVLGIPKGTIDYSFFYFRKKSNRRKIRDSSEDRQFLHSLQR